MIALKKTSIVLAIILLVCFDLWGTTNTTARLVPKKASVKDHYVHRAAYVLGEIAIDAFRLNYHVFSLDSIKILTAMTPFYLAGRMFDERIQCHFYDRTSHKNINQWPEKCHYIAQHAVGIPMVFLSSLALWAPDADLRQTARIYAIGLPFVQSGKDMIKQVRAKPCLRPWNENFSRTQRSSGGFPSGHMANVTYMTTIFGMRHGMKFGLPLGLFSLFVFADFINCNRHYLSQLVAGAGLGVIYAFAANKVIEKNLSERYEMSVGVSESGRTLVGMAFKF